MEVRALPAERAQLARRRRVIARLAEHTAGAHRDLVRADDERIAVLRAHRLRLEHRKPQRRVGGRFAAERALVDERRGDVEAQAQALEERLAVARGRGKDEPPGMRPHFGMALF